MELRFTPASGGEVQTYEVYDFKAAGVAMGVRFFLSWGPHTCWTLMSSMTSAGRRNRNAC